MDTDTLVEDRIDDGLKLINRLLAEKVDVTVACWVKPSEKPDWLFYIASRTVDNQGRAAAIREVFRTIQSMPDIWIPTSDIKVIGFDNPIAKDVLEIQRNSARQAPMRFHGPQLGDLAIDEAYIYPAGQQTPVINRSELEFLIGDAVKNTASRLGIPNAQFFSLDELREQVKEKDPRASELLEAFIGAFWQWFDFERRVEALRKQGRLATDEHQQLAALVEQKRRTRDALLAYLPSFGK